MKRKLPLILLLLYLVLSSTNAGGSEEDKYGGGPIVFIKPVRAVIFEHRLHLGKDLSCRSCHPDIFPKKIGVIEGKADFTMESFRQGKYCGKCHDGTSAFSVEGKCTWCHIGVQGHKHLEEYELGIK